MEPYNRNTGAISKKASPPESSSQSTCFVKKLFTMVAVEDPSILSFTPGKEEDGRRGAVE